MTQAVVRDTLAAMSKRDKRKREKEEKKAKKAKNAQLGYCHGCGEPWTKLTFEHVPPKRVQALIPEKYIRFNPLEKIDKTKRELPPCVIARGGLQVKSFGECCQQLTQTHYGQAFFDWSRIVFEMCKSIPEGEDRLQAVVEIEPLAVIKQVASIVLAAAEFNPHRSLARLRRFIQDPAATGVPADFEFFAYLNPVRPDYQLPQCRLIRKTSVLRNFETGAMAMVLAEVSVPPLGYVAIYSGKEQLDESAKQLMPINHFGGIALNQRSSVALDIPVRTPFGPFPLRYMQDADKERQRIEAESIR